MVNQERYFRDLQASMADESFFQGMNLAVLICLVVQKLGYRRSILHKF
jgi:hypothetical protein